MAAAQPTRGEGEDGRTKRRQCGTQEAHERLLEAYPAFRARLNTIELAMRRSVERGEAQRTMRKLITIPVVVHVVYRTAAENISTRR